MNKDDDKYEPIFVYRPSENPEPLYKDDPKIRFVFKSSTTPVILNKKWLLNLRIITRKLPAGFTHWPHLKIKKRLGH